MQLRLYNNGQWKSAAVTKEIEDLHDDHNNYTELVCDVASFEECCLKL